MKRSTKNRRNRPAPPWTEFVEADALKVDGSEQHNELVRKMIVEEGQRVFVNSRYQVWVREFEQADGTWVHLSWKCNDRSASHDWRDIQRIKNELVGPEREAIEIYPPESMLVDTANQFHIWVLPEGSACPVGFREPRVVSDLQVPGFGSQRPWEADSRPDDLLHADDMDRAMARLSSKEE